MGTTTRWLRGLWRTLGSGRLATILLAALLCASLLASLFPQMPADGSTGLTASPAARESWLAAVALRYRHATGILDTLGLFDAYHALWFLALLAALLLNTLACTIQRVPRLWRSLTQTPTIARPEAFYRSSAHRSEWPASTAQEGVAAAQNILAQHRYSIYVEHDQPANCASIYAERGRWVQASTFVSHVTVLLLVIATSARPALGWQESQVALIAGEVRPIDHKHGLAVQAGTLTLDRHPGGQLRDYRVPLTVLVDSSPVLTQTVRINHPVTFQGVAFHLQGYGPAARLTAPEGAFDLAFDGVQAREVTMPRAGLRLRVAFQPEGPSLFVEVLAADGSLLGSGTVADGQEIEIQGIPITFTLSHYTVWQISHDPTFGPVVALAGLLLAAAVVSLWIPHRRVWLRVDGQKAQMVTGTGSGGGDHELEVLAAEIRESFEGKIGG